MISTARLLAISLACCSSFNVQGREFSAQGRIEGTAPTGRVAFTVPGTIAEVSVKPGDIVKRGQKLAVLQCTDREARVALARAEVARAHAAREKLRSGARHEERSLVSARLSIADAEERAAQNRFNRTARLREKGNFVSEAEFEQSKDLTLVTERRRAAAAAELALVTAPARADDERAATAEVEAASARLAANQADLEKCSLRAPYDAMVLKVFFEPGDTFVPAQGATMVSISFGEPVNVRVQVDERDVFRLRLGQPVLVRSAFDPTLRMEGAVIRIEGEMGRRSILSPDPGERNDRDVLEAIVRLKPPVPQLPVGLRVVATFKGDQ